MLIRFAATVFFHWPNKEWQLLGMISNEKPSAIFKLSLNKSIDYLSDIKVVAQVGISIEPILSVQEQLSSIQQIMPVPKESAAQKILQNFYNFAVSFLEKKNDGEYISAKVFMNWFNSFKSKLDSDSSFLHSINQ